MAPPARVQTPKGDAGTAGRNSVLPRAGRSGSGAPSDGGTLPAVDPRAPIIQIVAPEAADDPDRDEVLTDNTVKVRCSVTKSKAAGARNVDPGSVRIVLVDLEKPAASMAGAVTSVGNDEYEAEFSLSARANGVVAFECSAADSGTPPLQNSATLETFVDRGPSLEILDPKDGTGHALANAVQIRFRVAPAPLNSDDDEADVTDIRLEVLGLEFDITEDPEEPGLFTAEVPFNDPELFSMPPSTAEIIVTATNSRTPTAATRRVESHITLDGKGPEIKVVAPKLLSIVGGEVTLQLTITDPSGVQDDSVSATILHSTNPVPLNDWTVSGSTYTEVFNTNVPAFQDITQITINITASDRVGNRSTEVSHILRLDNVPPLISLDSPTVREWIDNATSACSDPFDPLGDDAINDLGDGLASVIFRIRVQELVTHVPGPGHDYVAGIKENSVKLFARRDDDVPLVIDTNGDGYCDDINTNATVRPVVNDEFMPVRPTGTAYYKNPYEPTADHPGAAYCNSGTATMPPKDVCDGARMTRVIPQALRGGPFPAIYGFNPSNNANVGACAGEAWQILEPVGGEGWVCVAARTEDNVGNVGVSRPIRICLDDLRDAAPACLTDKSDPPTCTDGCTPLEFPSGWIQSRD